MAEDKKSFVAYADWKNQFSLLSDEEAGKLIKHIFSYVNDENPEFDENDRLLKICFEPIKQQLKRDLKKFEKTKEDRSSNGVIGNLKRWHLDLHELYEKGEITLENAKNIALNRVKSGGDNSDRVAMPSDKENRKATSSDKKNRKASQTVANIAVNVDDNVNENVNVNENDINNIDSMKDGKNQTSIQTTDFDKIYPDQIVSVETAIKLLKSEKWRSWRERIGMQKSILPDKMFELFDIFENHLKDQNQFEKSAKDAQQHFSGWYEKVYLKSQTKNDDPKSESDPNTPPDNSGNWIWYNKKWFDKNRLAPSQLKRILDAKSK